MKLNTRLFTSIPVTFLALFLNTTPVQSYNDTMGQDFLFDGTVSGGYSNHKATDSKGHISSHLYSAGGNTAFEFLRGGLSGLRFSGDGNYGWGMKSKRSDNVKGLKVSKGALRNQYNIRGKIGWNLAHVWEQTPDYFVHPYIAYAYERSHFTRAHIRASSSAQRKANIRKRSTTTPAFITWSGPWVGLDLGFSIKEQSIITFNLGYGFALKSTSQGLFQRADRKTTAQSGHGYLVEASYRYAIDRFWGLVLAANYRHYKSGRNGLKDRSIRITTGLSLRY